MQEVSNSGSIVSSDLSGRGRGYFMRADSMGTAGGVNRFNPLDDNISESSLVINNDSATASKQSEGLRLPQIRINGESSTQSQKSDLRRDLRNPESKHSASLK